MYLAFTQVAASGALLAKETVHLGQRFNCCDYLSLIVAVMEYTNIKHLSGEKDYF